MTIAVTLVEHGYQIDILDTPSYNEGKLKEVASECRSYGHNINVQDAADKLLLLIRNLDK